MQFLEQHAIEVIVCSMSLALLGMSYWLYTVQKDFQVLAGLIVFLADELDKVKKEIK